MFRKFVSNLPFNPALGSQVTFYIRRLRHEETTRRFGFAFITVAFIAQIFISISPPQSTLAADNNDIVFGGGTKAQIAQSIRNNRDRLHSDLETIFKYYGLSADDVANGTLTTISTVGSNNYYSIGRSHRDGNDIPVDIWGAQTSIYSRRLDGWARKSWSAIKIANRDVWILTDCGNVVTQGHYKPPQAPPPELKISKQNTPSNNVMPGDLITYSLIYSNSGGQSQFTAVFDQLPPHTTFVSSSTPFWKRMDDASRVKFMPDNGFAVLASTGSYSYPLTVIAKVNDDAPNGAQLCNRTSIGRYLTQTDFQTSSEAQVCNTVSRLCPDGTPMPSTNNCEKPPAPPTPPPTKTPTASCTSLRTIQQLSTTKYRFEAEVSLLDGATVSAYDFEFTNTDGTKVASTVKSAANKATVDHDFSKPGTYRVKVVANTSVGQKTSDKCELSLVVEATPTPIPPVLSKKAKNITQNINDANGTTAKNGDVIEYTLTVTNASLVQLDNVTFRDEDLADVSEYADIVKESIVNGSFSDTLKILHYNDKFSLKANESASKTFRVIVKESRAPASTSDPKSNDLAMFNEYGNDITIFLPGSPAKTIEKTVTTIPQTGPGTGLFASTFVFMLAAYLYARSRTSRQELVIIHSELVGGEI